MSLRDSTAVTGKAATVSLAAVLPLDAAGSIGRRVFARDSAGFYTEISMPPLRVLTGMIRPPMRALTLPAPVNDVAMDSKRGVAYLAYAGRREIGVVNLARAFTDTAFQQGGGTILSSDGGTAYLATWSGYLKVRTADGAVLERARLPLWAMQLAISDDGGTLIAIGGTTTYFEPPNNQVLIISLH